MSNNWPQVKLGKVVTSAQRAEAPMAGTAYRQIGVKLWGEGAYERETMDGAQTRYGQLFRAEADDIIVNKIWARNGSVAVVPPVLAGCYGSGEFPMFTPAPDQLDPRWMHWLTKTPGFWAQCDEKSRGTSGKNRIRPEQFLSIEIPLPSVMEQRRIVARIEELAAKIEEARGLREHATDETEALLVAETRQSFTSAANGWSTRVVEDCCQSIIDYRGRTPSIAEEGLPHLTSANIKNGRIDWTTTKFVTKETYRDYMTRGIPKPGDIIFTMEAPLGEAAVVPDTREFSLAQRTLLLRPKADVIESCYLAMALTSPDVREAIYAKATGTTVKGIASKRFKQIPLPIPTLSKQREIVAYLKELQTKTDILAKFQQEASAELDALMPSILDKAFRGEL